MRNHGPGGHVVRPMEAGRVPTPHVGHRAHVVLVALVVLLALVVSGCSLAATPGPTIIPGPSGGSGLSPAELRLLLVDQMGPRWYCDPDEFPVAHGSEQDRAIEQWPQIEAENELMRAIASRLGIDVNQPVNDAGKLAIYRQWKVAVSIPLDVVDSGHFHFDYLAQPVAGATEGVHTVGTIDDRGTITV